MNIAILSRGPQLYSTQALAEAARLSGHQVSIIDHLYCQMMIGEKELAIRYGSHILDQFDAVIPRIGASVTFHGAALIRQFELMNVFTTLKSEALLKSRDKLRCLQLLGSAGIGIPKTAFSNYIDAPKVLIDQVGGIPVVIKLLKGTHGLGVILGKDMTTSESILEAFDRVHERVMVQEFIKESNGEDIRAFVVDGEIVASMKRKAVAGEFRSNLHRGATAINIKLDSQEIDAALKAVALLGLDVAGVDILQSDRGPLILEVNPSPGLEGITTVTGVDVAQKIISFIEAKVNKNNTD